MKKEHHLKNFDHLEVEKRIYNFWESNKLFASKPRSKKKKFSIIMPPPNVTGNLHIGHALNMTIQDILCRYWRMNGRDVLWQPGTDHAGIATQNIVEKNLLKNEKIKKNTLGKEKFILKVWEWKNKSGNNIINQIKRLGASPDWDNLKFTLDKDVSYAVNYVFVKLYKKGLIYKDRRLVNWDIKLQTAISDLEVELKELKGKFIYIKYFLENSNKFISVATTRPETLFGDSCIAVNPKDSRYRNFIGKKVKIPLTEKFITVLEDEYVDSSKGSGALKVTPAHDFNDFIIGKKLKVNFFSIFDKQGKFNENVPAKYRNIDRLKARSIIIEDLKKINCLQKTEDITHSVPHGDRSGSIIEPFITDQWFLDVKNLANEAVKKVKKKDTVFYPQNWTKLFFTWMKEIQPWCISRQIWWGHQLPVWYGPDNKIFVNEKKELAMLDAKKHYKKNVKLKAENDVLDTWFSSALWPLTTLGWPKKTLMFKKYFPTDVLVTGFDIIFFWVSRMMMQSVSFTKKVPFKKVYIHPLIRDKFGKKMSKSQGNVIDPIDLIDKYGADPLRLTLASLAAQGKDIKLSEDNVKLNRNFITKIWNSYKFLDLNKCTFNNSFNTEKLEIDVNIWIIKNIYSLIESVDENIKKFRFNEAVKEIYTFTKNVYCDWYLEVIKVLINNANNNYKNIKELKECASYCFSIILKVSHPFIPFVSDEIYVSLMKNNIYLDQEKWPKKKIFKYKKATFEHVIFSMNLISKVRNIRGSLDVEPKNVMQLLLNDKVFNKISKKEMEMVINSLARVKIQRVEKYKKNLSSATKFIFHNNPCYILKDQKKVISKNIDKDFSFLKKELNIVEKEINRIEIKLNNKDFLDKAPIKIVDNAKYKINKYYKSKKKY